MQVKIDAHKKSFLGIRWKGEPLNYSRNYNYAPSWTYYDWEIDNYFANIEQNLWGDWKLRLGYNLKKSEVKDKMLYLNGSPSWLSRVIPNSVAIFWKSASSLRKKPNFDFFPARREEKGYFTIEARVE